MKISILIAAHRAAEHVALALSSVEAQAFRDWDLSVAFCSEDAETGALVRDFASRHRAVRLDPGPADPGCAPVRNRLLRLAAGDAVAFLEPADEWTADHLANAAQLLASGADVVVAEMAAFDWATRRALPGSPLAAELASNPVRTLFARDAIPAVSCVVARRSVVATVGEFDSRFGTGEARDFWLRCALASARFALTGKPTCRVYRNGTAAGDRPLLSADAAVQFYEKYRDLAAVPSALRRRLLAGSLVAQGRLLRSAHPAEAARCFRRAWSLQPVQVQTLGQFALTGWKPDRGKAGS